MPRTIAAIAPKRTRAVIERACIVQARAEIVSLGGAVLLGIGVLITAVFLLALSAPVVTTAQRFIAGALMVGVWLYLLNSVTERLSLCGSTLVFRSALGRTRTVPLAELDALILTHEGLNLERGIETIEIRRDGARPDRIPLGPCWQRNKLEAFLRSVERAMRGPQTFTEEK